MSFNLFSSMSAWHCSCSRTGDNSSLYIVQSVQNWTLRSVDRVSAGPEYEDICFFYFGLWDPSSPARDQTLAMTVKVPSPNHWTAREVPRILLFKKDK